MLAARAVVVALMIATTLIAATGTAEARGLGTITEGSGVTVTGCKTPVNSIYGPLWHVTLVAKNATWGWRKAGVDVVRPGVSAPVNSFSRTLRPKQTRYGSVFASRLLGDSLVAGTGLVNGQGSGGRLTVWDISTC